MGVGFSCRTFSRGRLWLLERFLNDHRQVLEGLPRAQQDGFVRICAHISHLRSRKAVNFFMETFRALETLKDSPSCGLIVSWAAMLGSQNWAMVHPFLASVQVVGPDEDTCERWMLLARAIAYKDIDSAVTFLVRTPDAIETLGKDGLFTWGQIALEALEAERNLHKAAKAYLEESVINRCATSESQWIFFLQQAARVARRSPDAAEEFIRSGARVCLLLNEVETEQWVENGLGSCGSEEELERYFSGTSLRALDKRDGLASGVALKDRMGSLSLICEAYLGRQVRVRSNLALVGVKGFSGGAATDGYVVYLPDMAPTFSLLKLMALHQTSLLESHEWRERGRFDPFLAHVQADGRLIERFPGMTAEMEELADGKLPRGYPIEFDRKSMSGLPWWGDLFPELVEQTDRTIRRVKERYSDEADLSEEFLAQLLASVVSQGERDPDTLLSRLMEMLDQIDFASPDPEELEEGTKTYLYKEWDSNLSDYKLDWCLIRQRPVPDEPNSFVDDILDKKHGIVTLIRRQFMRLRPERFRKFKAQPYGDEVDLDALIQAIVEMRSGSFLSDNVYVRRDKRTRDVAVLFLLDLSGSTEENVNGRRVIDLEKEAMTIMAEALDSLGDRFAIYGFSSEGRFRVDLFSVKSFQESYDETVRYRLGSLEPKNLTRLGAVIRHAIHKLHREEAVVKLMVILTDGRPYDLEYGNLDYAAQDSGRAIREARQHGIHPFIITTDKKGSDYLKQICSQTQSIIVPRVEVLPMVLPALYKRLTA
ncbi:nitric oxide reductase activation protein NorD [Thermodesulfobacteriota bacterium]